MPAVPPCPPILQASEFNLGGPTDQIYWHLDQLMTHCRHALPRICTNILDCVIPKTYNKKKAGFVSFTYHHNRCGHVNWDQCDKILNCCHKVHTINVGSIYATSALLKYSFYKTSHSLGNELLPSLDLKTYQWLNHKGRRFKVFAQAFRGICYNT